jgi:hypothetical protein
MSKIIKFINTFDLDFICQPEPAARLLPEWYRNQESYIGGQKKPTGGLTTPATIKKCVPVFDALTLGYIICSAADVFVSQREDAPYFAWSNFSLISFHPVEQAPLHPKRQGSFSYPKWNNPWGIQTPKGYSTLFVQPFHRESPFTILEGVVDTDTYISPVNFPFVLNDPKFEGLIPVGTPIAQVIPFKRESWKMTIGNAQDIRHAHNVKESLQTRFFDRYKKDFWSRKQFN